MDLDPQKSPATDMASGEGDHTETSKRWATDAADPEVAVPVGEFGDAIQEERRRMYTSPELRTDPTYCPSRETTQPRFTVYNTPHHKDVLPEKFGGKTPWLDYKRHFEVCMMLNRWDDIEAGQYLATRLQGPALKVLSNLPTGAPISYTQLVAQLERRFGPGQQADNFLMELRMRRRHRDESLQELGQAIRDLTSLAYPELDCAARERLARGHFSEAIEEPEIRAGIFRAHATTLDDAIRAALATESFVKAEKMRDRCRPTRQIRAVEGACRPEPVPVDERTRKEVNELKSSLQQLTTMIEKLATTSNTSTTKGASVCYNCGETGHFRRECPKYSAGLGNGSRPTRWTGGRPQSQPGPRM